MPHKTDLCFLFAPFFAGPCSHYVWLRGASRLAENCLSKKAGCRIPNWCAPALNTAPSYTQLPDLGSGVLWAFRTSSSSPSPTLKPRSSGSPLSAHHGGEPRLFLPPALSSLLAWSFWGSRLGARVCSQCPNTSRGRSGSSA